MTFRVLPSASLTGKTRVTPLWSVHESSRIPVSAIAFATEQVAVAKDAIAGVPFGGTEALLDDLADAVVARDH